MSTRPGVLKLLTSGSRNVFNPNRSFYWPSTRFVRRKQKICLVFINTPPKELMDGHVILKRHGLRVAVRCAVGEGEKKERSAVLFLHFGWAAVIGRGVSICFSFQIALRAPYAFAYELVVKRS